VIVAAALVANRDGRRQALAFLGSAVAACAAIVAPAAAVWPSALVENTIVFPLGLAGITSAAASPLPGHLIAGTGHAGHLIAIGLLVTAGAAIAASLLVRPPTTVPSAVWRLAIGLSLMFLLAPATRFGYFIYPAALLMWLEVVSLSYAGTPTTVVGLPLSAYRSGPGYPTAVAPGSALGATRDWQPSGETDGAGGHPVVAGRKE
jgi:hypothetical protein